MRFVTKRGDLYKKYKAGWSLLFQLSVTPPVGLITNSVIQRYEE